jgi:long-chain fatty acid transport protein
MLGGDLLVSADVIYKDWSSADLYKDIYRDQTVFALGAQLTTGDAKWRLGYSHARDPIKRNVGSSIAGVTSMAIGGAPVPLNTSLVQYFQATNAEPVWEDQVTAGFGYQILPNLAADTHVAFSLNNKETIGNTTVDASAWQVGLGLTWAFK